MVCRLSGYGNLECREPLSGEVISLFGWSRAPRSDEAYAVDPPSPDCQQALLAPPQLFAKRPFARRMVSLAS